MRGIVGVLPHLRCSNGKSATRSVRRRRDPNSLEQLYRASVIACLLTHRSLRTTDKGRSCTAMIVSERSKHGARRYHLLSIAQTNKPLGPTPSSSRQVPQTLYHNMNTHPRGYQMIHTHAPGLTLGPPDTPQFWTTRSEEAEQDNSLLQAFKRMHKSSMSPLGSGGKPHWRKQPPEACTRTGLDNTISDTTTIGKRSHTPWPLV